MEEQKPDENKTAEEKTASTSAGEEKKNQAQPTDSEKNKQEEQKNIDYYEQELEKAVKAKERAEYAAETLKRKVKEQKVEEDTEFEPVLTPEDIQKAVKDGVREGVGNLQKDIQRDKIDSLIAKKASSPKEIELIKFNLENVVKSSGDIEVDIANAQAIANRGKMEKQILEAARTNNSQASQAGGSGQPLQLPVDKQVLTTEQKRIVGDTPLEYDKAGKLVAPAIEKYKKKYPKHFPANK